MQKVEFELRGTYLSYACDIEWSLTEIICTCFIDKYENRDAFKVIMLEKVMFGKKLNIVRQAVKNYNEEYYQKYKGTFKVLDRLSSLRNLLAHSVILPDRQTQDRIF